MSHSRQGGGGGCVVIGLDYADGLWSNNLLHNYNCNCSVVYFVSVKDNDIDVH